MNEGVDLTEDDKIDSSGSKPYGGRSESEIRVALKHAETVQTKYKGVYLRAIEGTASKRDAIKAACYECVGFESVAENVHDCRGFRCPLYAYRPYQEKGDFK